MLVGIIRADDRGEGGMKLGHFALSHTFLGPPATLSKNQNTLIEQLPLQLFNVLLYRDISLAFNLTLFVQFGRFSGLSTPQLSHYT